MRTQISKSLATIMTFVLLSTLLFRMFYAIDAWAAKASARPVMGAALVSVLEVGLLLVAVALAPPLSAVLFLISKNL